MSRPDVICIGAINYDFVFDYDPGKESGKPGLPESGIEDLGDNEKDDTVAERIRDRLYTSSSFVATVGGSAYLTIKTISYIDAGLATSYVGIYAAPEEIEAKAGLTVDFTKEFHHLDNLDWLFESDGPPGRALVRLHRGLRHTIEIGPGCNNLLAQKVIEREKELVSSGKTPNGTKYPFTEFLASAKWVHLTSFSNFEQFDFFVDRIAAAKDINPSLRFSIDPGDEYTREHSKDLSKAFRHADYIFLSIREFNNIKGGREFPWRSRVDAVGELLEGRSSPDCQVLIVKSANRHVLENYLNGTPLQRTFWHPRLWRAQIRNDTGAGDVFAGGFIAGVLSPYLLTHQPAPVYLGATLAAVKMKYGKFPAKELRSEAWRFFEKSQHNEHDNLRQRIQILWEQYWPLLVSSLISFATGALVAIIFK